MSKTIIQVENLTKEYRLGSLGLSSFIEDCKSCFLKIIPQRRDKVSKNRFTALKTKLVFQLKKVRSSE